MKVTSDNFVTENRLDLYELMFQSVLSDEAEKTPSSIRKVNFNWIGSTEPVQMSNE